MKLERFQKEIGMNEVFDAPVRGIWSKYPAQKWEEGFVAGNGEIGVIPFGNAFDFSLIGNHHRLFLKGNNMQAIPNLSNSLGLIRKTIAEENYQAGIELFEKLAVEQKYQGLTMSDVYHPAVQLDFKLSTDKEWPIKEYYRSIEFDKGVSLEKAILENGQIIEKRLCVSKKEKVIVYELLSNNVFNLSFKLKNFKQKNLLQEISTNDEKSILQKNTYVDDSFYASLISWDSDQGRSEVSGHTVHLYDVKKVYVKIAIEVDDQPEPTQKKGEAMIKDHMKDHQIQYDSISLDLVDESERHRSIDNILEEMALTQEIPQVLYEKLYDASRYIISAMSGKALPNLQGIWSGDFSPAWSGDYTFDTNVQLAVSSFSSLGLFENFKGFFDRMNEYEEDFKENAHHYFGCRGFLVPVHASTTAKHVHWNSEWPLVFWTAGAGWLAHFYNEYWEYTLDKTFLEETALPFYEQTILFYEDFLELKNGEVLLRPSYSAENGMGDTSTMDSAVLKETMLNLKHACSVLGKVFPERYNDLLEKIPDYMIDSEGILKEWIDPNKEENPNHRHFSNLYPIFQSKEITKANTVLWKAAHKAFDERLEAWLLSEDGDTSSSHGRIHAAMCAIALERTGDIEKAVNELIKNRAFYSSLVTSHYNEQNVFNVDANGAFPKVVHDALLYSENRTEVTLFKAVPSWLSKGKLCGVRLPNGILVKQFSWDLSQRECVIALKSRHSTRLTIALQEKYVIQGIEKEKIDIQLDKDTVKEVRIHFSIQEDE